MKDFNYIEITNRNVSTNWNKEIPVDAILAVMGISSEAGEILKDIQKGMFNNKSINRDHLIEEIGDLLWYTVLLMKTLDVTFEQVRRLNIDKLRKKYPKDFINIDEIMENYLYPRG